MMDRQAALDDAVAGLARQEWRRAAVGWKCLLRAPNGDRCGIGHLIPDDRYRPSLERKAVAASRALRRAIDPKYGRRTARDARFLDQLQVAHDFAERPQEMRQNLRDLAIRWGLRTPPEVRGKDDE